MRIGIIYPQTEYGNDPVAIRDFAQTTEALGYAHVLAYDHILGANPDRPGGWQGPYTYQSPFHEPFVLFGFMAAFTTTLEFAPGIIILPQRPTALVAKQAATLDILSGRRLRLGVGIGWNRVEYIALGQDFHTRGRRIEEQVMLLRRLWSEPLVTYEGRWDTIPDAGINPLPNRQIPIWFGGHHPNVLRRVARMGDGWLPLFSSAADARPSLEQLKEHLQATGRDPGEIGVEARLHYGVGDPDTWAVAIDEWRTAGATHLTLNTMRFGLDTPEAHLKAIQRFADAIDLNKTADR